MGTYEIVSGLLYLLFGIISLILFFKVWGMTNNVKKLTQHFLENKGNILTEAKKLYILGDYDAALNIYKQCFVDEVCTEFLRIYNAYSMKEGQKEGIYQDFFEKRKSYYQKKLDKMGGKYQIDFARYDSYQKMIELYS